MAIVPFGKPHPSVDPSELYQGFSEDFINCLYGPLGAIRKVPGLILEATHASAQSIDFGFETTDGTNIVITNGGAARVNSGVPLTFTNFTGDALGTGGNYAYAEDGNHVYVAHGGKLARLDLTNLTITLLGEYTPNNVTHVVRSKSYLICNGDNIIANAASWNKSPQFGNWIGATALEVIDANTFLVGGGDLSNIQASVYRSVDSGDSWALVQSNMGGSFVLDILDLGSGVVLVGASTLWRSTNSGSSFSDLGAVGSLTAVAAFADIGGGVVLASGANSDNSPVIYRSTDSGATFPTAVHNAVGLTSVSVMVYLGSNVVLAGGSDGVIYRSTDAGLTFSAAQSLTAEAVLGFIHFTGSTNVVAGQDGNFWRSTDDGVNWTEITSDYQPVTAGAFYGVGQAISSTVGYIALAPGAPLSNFGSFNIYRTEDAGLTWHLHKELDDGAGGAAKTIAQSRIRQVAGERFIVSGNDSTPAPTDQDEGQGVVWLNQKGPTLPSGQLHFSVDKFRNYSDLFSWQFVSAEATPDVVSVVHEGFGGVFAGGNRSIEIFFSSGGGLAPWLPSDPALEFGVVAPWSVVKFKSLNTYMYLSISDSKPQIVRQQGRSQIPLSGPYDSIIEAWTDRANCRAWGMVLNQMLCYVLTSPGDNITIGYNIQADHWFRLSYWDGTAHNASLVGSYWWSESLNRHMVGDRRANGRLYSIGGFDIETVVGGATADPIRMELIGPNEDWGTMVDKDEDRREFWLKRGQALDNSNPCFTVNFRDNGVRTWGQDYTLYLNNADDDRKDFFTHIAGLGSYKTRQMRIVHEDQQSDFILNRVEAFLHGTTRV